MNTYYAVGSAMHTLERGMRPFAANPRDLDAELILTEAFEKKVITRVFLTYDDARDYAETLERFYGFPKRNRLGEHAPVLTFTTDRIFHEKDLKQERVDFNVWHEDQAKNIKYVPVEAGLGFNEISPTKLNFPTDQRVPAIADFGAKKKMCLVM